MLLMIDNYDSFTYNLVQYFGVLGVEVRVVRNDRISVEEVAALNPRRIVISPGPGDPTDAGVSVPLIRRFAGEVPILGVCLGHQSLGYAFGGEIVRAKRIMHGKVSPVQHDDTGVHRGVPNPFEATRYHSLVIRPESLPGCFRVTARTTDDDEIMAISDDAARLYGIQYHPESILTTEGMGILKNFVEMT
ncbi:MAG: aminodeoxychorismate/anthranilate synthase component II [Deferrisomatales bacterium]|nr:aminodeoxychorismate/anthranilate synthase component II [Deferrisomatales bacterium]